MTLQARRSPRRILRILLIFALTASLPAVSTLGDTVTYNAGGGIQQTLEGAVVSEAVDEVVFELDFGQRLRIAVRDIVELKKGDHPVVTCRKRYEKALAAGKVDDWLALARYAKENGLKYYAREAYRRVLSLDPENEEAHLGLGHVKFKGKWRTKSEARRAQQWDRKVVDMRREFAGRPWATVPPIKTKYFVLKCGSTEEVAEQYRAFLEKVLFPLYEQRFPRSKFPRHHDEPGRIYIMANVNQFREFMLVPMGIGGFFLPQKNEVYAFHGSFGIRGTTLHVLAHEACHVFQWRIFKNINSVPTWLVEGMAVYFGDGAKFKFSFRDDPKQFKPDAVEIVVPYDRVIPLRRMIRANLYIPVEKVLRVPHMRFGARLYSNAWLIVFWCMDGQKYGAHHGEGRKLLDAYIEHASGLDVRNGSNDPKHLAAEAQYMADLVRKFLGMTLSEWDERLKQFVMDIELEPLGTWNPRSRTWKGLNLELRCPAGLRIIDQQDLRPGEVVAFGPRVGTHPRITVWSVSNDFLARAEPELVSRWISELYALTDEMEKEPAVVAGERTGFVEAIFTGRRRVRLLPGEKPPSQKEPLVKVRFRATATPSRVYFFGCESPPDRFDRDNRSYFEKFFKSLKLTD